MPPVVPDSSSAAHTQAIFAALTLAAAMIFGGGQGALGDTVAQLLALLLLGLVAWRQLNDSDARLPAFALLAALPLLLPALQLSPLPASLLNMAPVRLELSHELSAVQLELPSRVSLIPAATERALLWLLPAVALFLATLQMNPSARRMLLAVFVLLAVAGVVLGIAQLAGGPQSELRFYTITNPSEAVGFFANRNHFASQLAMALPLVLVGTAWAVSERLAGRRLNPIWMALGILAAVLLILGIALARSRAGLLLGMLAIALSVPGMLAFRRRRGTRRILAAVIAIALLVSVQFALLGILERLGKDPLDDARLIYAPLALDAANAYAPLGAGLGSFLLAFQPFEGDRVAATIFNHAHNDYLELWLDSGWPVLLLASPLLGVFALAGFRVWQRSREPSGWHLLARSAWIAMLIVLLHSLVDYPLRTSANLAIFGVLAAMALGSSGRPSELGITERDGLHR